MIKLPEHISKQLNNPEWTKISIGCSAADVFRLIENDGRVTYLKVLDKSSKQSLQSEQRMLNWLQGKLPVPRVLDYVVEEDREILWITEVPGTHAADKKWEDQLQLLVQLLAKGLREIHNVDVKDCPFNKNISSKLLEAEHNMKAGLVDEKDFDITRIGRETSDLFQELISSVPAQEDLVFTHGDFCLPNIIINENNSIGFIDMGTAGVADRYQDIALAVRSFNSNFGKEWGALFLQEYGLEKPDWVKIDFYQFLDEFF